ncbi:MAG: hypothetical protein SPG09_10325 [Lachnospiraceae bacterium]|nr:hypothetical protein [bacterium]MDY5517987.1 hypothetical protein [Lachnospiraceae bacterium]
MKTSKYSNHAEKKRRSEIMKRFIKSAIACIAAVAMVATVAPVTTQAAAKAVTVTNQKELEAAIKKGATKITIKTPKAVKITIPSSKKALKVAFVVDAAKATITNKATVKSVTVKDAKTFTESGKNNDIKVTDSKLTLKVAKGSKGAIIDLAKTNASVTVKANGNVSSINVLKKAKVNVTVAKDVTVGTVEVAAKNVAVTLNAKGTVADVNVADNAAGATLNITASGAVKNVTVDAKADVAVAGTTDKAVNVTVNAADTTVKAETKVETTLNADAKVELGDGAEGSKVATGSADVKAEISNETKGDVTVSDSTGKETTVGAGETTKTEEPTKPTTPTTPVAPSTGGSTGGGSSSSGGSGQKTWAKYKWDTYKDYALEVTGAGIKATEDGYEVKLSDTVSKNYKTDLLKSYVKTACEQVSEKASTTVQIDGLSKKKDVTVTNTEDGSYLTISATVGDTVFEAKVTLGTNKIVITRTK